MASELLMDNWTFQNAGELLDEGLCDENTHEIAFSDDGKTFSYQPMPFNLTRLESLFQVLHHIVLGGQCVVDSGSVACWEDHAQLGMLRKERLVATKPFFETQQEWRPIRKAIEDALCTCPMLRERHQANIRSFDPKTE